MENEQVDRINELLARELGRTPQGDGVWRFDWSEDLFLPGPGRMEAVQLSSGIIVRERRRVRMTYKHYEQWLATKWLAPEKLTYNQRADWHRDFGEDYPVNGFRVISNYVIDRGSLPTHADAERLIAGVRHMEWLEHPHTPVDPTRRPGSLVELMNQKDYEEDRQRAAQYASVGDEIANEFTAGLNPKPGSRWQTSYGGLGESPAFRKETEN